MSDIVMLTESERYRFRVRSEIAISYDTKDPERAFQQISLNFIIAGDPSSRVERIICVSQPLLGNDSIRADEGAAIDLASEFDLFRSPEEATWVVPVSRGGDITNRIYPYEGDENFDGKLQRSKVFSPLMAAVVPFSQTVNGGSFSVKKHSLLPQTIKGVKRIGAHTHVLVVVDKISMMITFQDNRPVQLEYWSGIDSKTSEPVLLDRIRTRWSKASNGELVPVELLGARAAIRFGGEYRCEIDWEFGDDVADMFFDRSTQGLIGFAELLDEDSE